MKLIKETLKINKLSNNFSELSIKDFIKNVEELKEKFANNEG